MKYAVVSDGIVDAVTEERMLIDPAKILISQGDGDGSMVIDLTEQEYASAMSFTADLD